MRDPYEVLGVSRDASDEQLKAAYRQRAREAAAMNGGVGMSSRMDEIDNAYDTILSWRRNSGSYVNNGYNYQYDAYESTYQSVRSKLNSRHYSEADIELDTVPLPDRNAEWYFLKGSIQRRKGWLSDAESNFERATRLDPSNSEYAQAYNDIQDKKNGGYRTSRGGRGSGCDTCDCCTTLCVLDCCCESMDMDCIPCC